MNEPCLAVFPEVIIRIVILGLYHLWNLTVVEAQLFGWIQELVIFKAELKT